MPATVRPVLDVEVSRTGRATVVRPRGELDMATVPVLRDVLAGHRGEVILDLRELAFIDAAGLHLLLDADAAARRDGLDLTLVPGRTAGRLLGLTHVRDRFSIRESPE